MASWCEEAVALLQRPAVAEMAVDVLLCAVPIWAAVMIGLVVGWSWRPRWTGLLFLGLRTRLRILWVWVPPGLGARRLWLACTALSACSVAPRLLSSAFRRCRGKHQDRASPEDDAAADRDGGGCADGSRTNFEGEHDTVTEKDLEHLLQLLDNKESGDTAWQNLMERRTSNMTYKAWRREPEEGPIMYCSRTIFEDATPELVRDFFWDGDFRLKWDPMLAYSKSLDEFPQNGATIVHWIKKFPFFCSDREYIFGGRIWESGKTYYCVTKGVPYPSLPKKEKPRRVELYFSSWRIRAVQSPKHVGQQSACEVTLVHYEDMGIPKDVARVAVRHGMWGAVKKLQSGFRAYQQMRDTENTLSHSAIMARMTTKISITASNGPLDHDLSIADKIGDENDNSHALQHGFDWKWVVVGGAVAAVCVLNTGLVGKVLLLGAARRQAKK
ncbi:hypothetical protein BDA96_06G186700 [Sorghum bicolor]|uniref:START domain-containing protein n=2 Tax=Sorghum bicolor TaxID=4558 RepID=A0A1B6PMG0_SORBI|nr:uncharacterized protein LOC110436563 isoform X1 [Sorghum bicolor]KAG0526910.1 hypothetical protein BDA96_06G186700 [Sorghum bicolor]KXG26852.1 hypothetical protein SORBI_3006G170700 [Sorghum bicolor]|eukprot:XP_021319534.1 uncharacterized protein LOC110436563 isoform X1 [Sorghum bicolor]